MKTNHLTLTTYLLLYLHLCQTTLAHNEIPPPPQKYPTLIQNVCLHPISQPTIPNGWILFQHGRILQLGPHSQPWPKLKNLKIISAPNLHLYPALIHANTTLGLVEINAVEKTKDTQEKAPLTPEVKSYTAFHPDSELLPVTRANGVLVVHSVPQGGIISGQSCLMRLSGWTPPQMAVQKTTGLHIRFSNPTSRRFEWIPQKKAKKFTKIREQEISKLNQLFQNAQRYQQQRQKNKNLRLDAVVKALQRQIPVFLHANSLAAIESAICWGAKWKLKMILVGGAEAHLAIPLLKQYHVPVILTGTLRNPIYRDQPYDHPYRLPYLLHQAGVPFAIAANAHPFLAAHQRNLPYQAAMAAAFGLPKSEALKSITLYPAQILGASKLLGSLEPGKEATFFLANGDILEITTQVKMAFVQGQPISLQNKHTRLYHKYLQKLQQQKP